MKVTIIIPYNRDRGYLKEAVASVPKGVQLLLSKGDGNWPQNFNNAYPEATGDLIKYLHEDDLLTHNCVEDSLYFFNYLDVDFIHGNALEFNSNSKRVYIPEIKVPTFEDLLDHNVIHSATTMYHRSVFDKVGMFNESKEMYSFEEYEFNLRCLKAGMKIGYVNALLGMYRRHPEQIIRTVDINERKKHRQNMLNSFKM